MLELARDVSGGAVGSRGQAPEVTGSRFAPHSQLSRCWKVHNPVRGSAWQILSLLPAQQANKPRTLKLDPSIRSASGPRIKTQDAVS
jgi:hypothetical protein